MRLVETALARPPEECEYPVVFLAFLGLFVVAAALLSFASYRFDRTEPTGRVRVIAVLINLAVMGAVFLATEFVTGHANVTMIPVALIATALVNLALTEAIRRRPTAR